MISSLLNACVTPCFCSVIVKTWLAFLYMRSLCHGLEPCLPKTEAKAYFRQLPCYARAGGGNLPQVSHG